MEMARKFVLYPACRVVEIRYEVSLRIACLEQAVEFSLPGLCGDVAL